MKEIKRNKRHTPDDNKKQVVDSIKWNFIDENVLNDNTDEHVVYKLYYGSRFIIHKGKNLAGSLFLLKKGYSYFVGYEHKTTDDRVHYYLKFYNWVKKHPSLQFRVEILLKSNNGYELLIKEQEELDNTIKNKKCLNNNITSYLPVFREKTNSYGWISKEDGDKFKEYLNNM